MDGLTWGNEIKWLWKTFPKLQVPHENEWWYDKSYRNAKEITWNHGMWQINKIRMRKNHQRKRVLVVIRENGRTRISLKKKVRQILALKWRRCRKSRRRNEIILFKGRLRKWNQRKWICWKNSTTFRQRIYLLIKMLLNARPIWRECRYCSCYVGTITK